MFRSVMKRIVLIVFCLMFLWLLNFILPKAANCQSQPLVWKLSAVMPIGEYLYGPTSEFCKAVTDRSGGRLRITFHPGGELGYRGTESLQLLRDKVLHISEVIAPYVGGTLPMCTVATLPGLCINREEGIKVRDAIRQILDKEFAAKFNSKLLFMQPFLVDMFWTKKECRTLEDFRGLKIRAYGAETAKLFSLMGAVPLTMPLGEVYVALQRGLVDGLMTSVDSVHSVHAEEVLDYGIRLVVSAYVPAEFVLVNLDSFQALPEDLQKIILDEAAKAEEETWELAPEVLVKEEAAVLKAGLKMFIEPNPGEQEKLNNLSRQVWEGWLKAAGPKGKEVLDAALEGVGKKYNE